MDPGKMDFWDKKRNRNMATKKTKTIKRLTDSQKKTIATMTAKDKTMREIAAKIKVAPSTVWRHQQTL